MDNHLGSKKLKALSQHHNCNLVIPQLERLNIYIILVRFGTTG